MSNSNDDQTRRSASSKGEELTDAKPDRDPTPDEEAAAERAARQVDVSRVGEHYEEMIELGANVPGEGQIEPNS
jgi:hypothetical protein